LQSSYDACLVGRRWARRGRAPTASRAAEDGVEPFIPEDDFGGFGIELATAIDVMAMARWLLAFGGATVDRIQVMPRFVASTSRDHVLCLLVASTHGEDLHSLEAHTTRIYRLTDAVANDEMAFYTTQIYIAKAKKISKLFFWTRTASRRIRC
jgi:hypothetical protein